MEGSKSEVLDLRTENGSKGKRKKKVSSQYATVPLPPCKICAGSATGYHFGVITCEACKAFFRRALIHKQEYKCAKNDNCDIIGKKLGNCSACRLKKCLELGMSKGGVRKGRYSIAIRTKAIVEAKESEGKDAASLTPSRLAHDVSGEMTSSETPSTSESAMTSLCSLIPSANKVCSIGRNGDVTSCPSSSKNRPEGSVNFSQNLELELLIDALVGCQEAVYPNLAKQYERNLILQAQIRAYNERKDKEEFFNSLFGKPSNVSTEEYQQIFAETGIDLDDRLQVFNRKGKLMEESISQYVNFAKIIPGFKNLNPKDVSNLLKAAHLEFWILGNYMLFNKDLEVAISLDSDHKSSRKDIEKFWASEWVDELFKYADRIQKLNLSLEEIVLIRVIVLTYTDRCKLKDRPQIQILQEKFLDCLNYQVFRSSTNPGYRLYKIFDLLLSIRVFSALNAKENQTFLKKWGFVIHEYPLWKEMLSYDDDM